ncbi:MAG: CDP-alcohol phosphatidyltransferase family protein [Ilumatobacteraceae bacterium]|nr:CDP-alcohol phosphatidyltransferase family protein [Ilumatobacteraceae bacterium]
MFDGKFRAPVDAAVKPMGAALRKTKLTPDHLTVVGLVVGAASAVAVGSGHLRWGLVLVILAALPDLLDGALAKASNTSSQRGAFFDSTVDRVTDALLLGGIAYYFAETQDPRLAVLPFAVSAVSSVISYQRAKAESLGLDAKGGLMERAERIVVLCIGLFIEPWVDGALVWILWGMLVLISITAVQRFVKVWKQAAVAPVTQARIDMRREQRMARRDARTRRRSTRVPLRERVPRRQD